MMADPAPHIAVIGAGIGGLAAALRLAHHGARVTVWDMHSHPGGKMRQMPTPAGPVDAGPTVLTMRHVFEKLFADTGSPLEAHVTLTRETVLARHFWPDGAQLDLHQDARESAEQIAAVFGPKPAAEFQRFNARAAELFDAFDAPMMQAAKPSLARLTQHVLKNPRLLKAMAPHRSLQSALRATFSDKRLAQLFGRYATYVGGRPEASPALLSLIWHAEAQGVWHVTGGMHALAQAIAARAKALGATFHYNSPVHRIELQNGKPRAIQTDAGRTEVDAVLFNGDPRALAQGHLGPAVQGAVREKGTQPRSLSAYVHSFAAVHAGPTLAAHNVFFGDTPEDEFRPLSLGHMPHSPTLYICAQDRFDGNTPSGLERFEIIMNAPPCPDDAPPPTEKEIATCQTRVFDRLRTFGLTFTPTPASSSLTMPAQFAQMFPASNGSLYGRSPHGMMAALDRPTVRTELPGLYLVGGGVHPGAGVPMATLCAQHAAAAIMQDHSLT